MGKERRKNEGGWERKEDGCIMGKERKEKGKGRKMDALWKRKGGGKGRKMDALWERKGRIKGDG